MSIDAATPLSTSKSSNFDTIAAPTSEKAAAAPTTTSALKQNPKIVFIHGFLDRGSVWWRVRDQLRALGLISETIDLPGMGGVKAAVSDISLERYADAVSALIEQVGAPVVLVGQSMGSQVADLIATRSPDQVAGLVLLAPVPLGGTALPDEVVGPLRRLGGDRDGLSGLRNMFSFSLDEEQSAELLSSALLVEPQNVVRIVDTWNVGHPSGREPARYNGPVLVIRGQADGFTTSELAGVTLARYPQARLLEIEHAGHWPHVEQSTKVAEAVADFASNI
ncbi:alpha/beta hydrolase [Paraburkholderia sp. C35]|uniref:alpha/beta fold hydrolase n=1 Tax=Paraburkholderia sp. C35 TaxID=2126993 RepID=UPI0013A52BF2|nr:alpha/beta hydrolase [Paraburkholderia sp. C35]